jgi:hypothetical protein
MLSSLLTIKKNIVSKITLLFLSFNTKQVIVQTINKENKFNDKEVINITHVIRFNFIITIQYKTSFTVLRENSELKTCFLQKKKLFKLFWYHKCLGL